MSKKFEQEHQVGFLKMPKGFSHLPSLSATRQFMAPSRIDLRDLCTPTEDQGSKPWCAAYAAAQWAENIKWRLTDCVEQIDPTPIYKYAKSIDGDPYGDGTTIPAVLEALKHIGVFGKECTVKVIRPSRMALKYAIHKFGCCLGGFGVSEEWWGVTKKSPVITGKKAYVNRGGHCVLVCGYDKEGIWIQNSWG